MSKSIRIRTTPGQDSNILIKVEQDFDFLEILSLKISQQDLYTSFCANYGVVVGRVIANKGFGVPNAKVSVFVPISDEDERNELIKDLYPFKDVTDKNKDNIRYNLLLSKTTCDLNTPVGTFPTKEEVLNNDIMIEIFDKYYKYTTKTNDAGDYMIFGVPTGQQTVHMDCDLSDSGIFSVRPYDFINNGFNEKLFKSRTEFKQSSNLDTLAQIKSGNRGIDVLPFWGDDEQCQIGITRVDFDTNFNFEPSALFIGSIFTDKEKNSLNKRCNPKNKMGDHADLVTGQGQLEVIRVNQYTYNYDTNGNPTSLKPLDLETFVLPDGVDSIDDDGTFTVSIPMNLDHTITDEFGNLVPSNDVDKGVPTKSMSRFKLKFTQPNVNVKFRTADLIVPSLNRVTGGDKINTDKINPTPSTENARWTTDINVWKDTNGNLTDTIFKDFQEFTWNQVYTISQYIPKYKMGGNRWSFLGLKGVDEGDNNPLPFTTIIKSNDILFALLRFFINIQAFFIKTVITLKNLTFCFVIKSKLIDNLVNALGGDKGLVKCQTCTGQKQYTTTIRVSRIEKDIQGALEGSYIDMDGIGLGSISRVKKIRFFSDIEKNTNWLKQTSLNKNAYTFTDEQFVGTDGPFKLGPDKKSKINNIPNTDFTDCNLIIGDTTSEGSDIYVWAEVEFTTDGDTDDGGTDSNEWINLGNFSDLKEGHFYTGCNCTRLPDGSAATPEQEKNCDDNCRTVKLRPLWFLGSGEDKTLPCESASSGDIQYSNNCGDKACDGLCERINGSFGIRVGFRSPKCNDDDNDSEPNDDNDSEPWNCTAICSVNDWKCCAILDLALSRNVFRHTFHDNWLTGSAYLFQYKYKGKPKKQRDPKKTYVKDKFCGPGGDTLGSDNYKNQGCGIRGTGEPGTSCLVRGFGVIDKDRNTSVYHENDYNTGASDIGDMIYCPETFPMKIINIGSTDVCIDALDKIDRCITTQNCLLDQFTSPGCSSNPMGTTCFNGTFYEEGYDTTKWVNQMGPTSYQNDSDVLLHLVSGQGKGNCDVGKLFKGQGGCDEFELENDEWEIITQVSKLYTDIILKSEIIDDGLPTEYEKLSWGETYLIGSITEEDDNGNMILNGFNYNQEQSGKFNPSSPNGELVDTELSDQSNKNHLRNTPYFYFGLTPGKTAIDKLRKNYFIN